MVRAIVLAAGKSTRFGTSQTKLSHTICGQEMIAYPVQLLASLGLKTTVVVGYQKELVTSIVHAYQPQVDIVEQVVQKGTGDAVLCTRHLWDTEDLLILNGDVPLLEKHQIEMLITRHKESKATISFMAAHNSDPSRTGYGRVIISKDRLEIIEQRDFKGDPTEPCLLNAGIYLIKRSFLESALPSLELNGQELYITDLIKKAHGAGHHVEILTVPFDTVRGINTLKELAEAEKSKRASLLEYWMSKGVRFTDPQSVHIDTTVTIGQDTTIGYGVQLLNGSHLGSQVRVDAFCILDSATIQTGAIILSHCVIAHAQVHTAAQVGPFAHVHRGTILHAQAVIGNFVEVSKSTVGKASKAKHLTYLGQAQIGQHVNIGAGTITCNYDGIAKHTTTIENNAFIGSNVALIAPVTVGQEAVVAAGSTITENVPAHALAIARERQVTKGQYTPRIKAAYQTSTEAV
jgi:bifunctional UDP-N-acetylglucosamine pyrophosphorylase / glucosamine-1-phosphate N-acetyltransferase